MTKRGKAASFLRPARSVLDKRGPSMLPRSITIGISITERIRGLTLPPPASGISSQVNRAEANAAHVVHCVNTHDNLVRMALCIARCIDAHPEIESLFMDYEPESLRELQHNAATILAGEYDLEDMGGDVPDRKLEGEPQL